MSCDHSHISLSYSNIKKKKENQKKRNIKSRQIDKRKRKILVSKCTIILSIDYMDRVQALANNQI